MNTGNSAFDKKAKPQVKANVGGNSGAVVSPAPGLGLSAYQTPKAAGRPSKNGPYNLYGGNSTR